MTDSDFRREDDEKPAEKPRMAAILLLALSAGLCLWVLFGTDACHHPLEHVAAFVWLTVATPPIAMAWAAGRRPDMAARLEVHARRLTPAGEQGRDQSVRRCVAESPYPLLSRTLRGLHTHSHDQSDTTPLEVRILPPALGCRPSTPPGGFPFSFAARERWSFSRHFSSGLQRTASAKRHNDNRKDTKMPKASDQEQAERCATPRRDLSKSEYTSAFRWRSRRSIPAWPRMRRW